MGRAVDGSHTRSPGPAFGSLLRYWRGTRRLSQLALAEEAEISVRHLSFLETGRSLPSRDMVERLAETLDIPFADWNVLLLAAGYAPIPPEGNAATAEFETHERMLDAILSQQGAVPSLVIDEDWKIRMRNAAAARLFGAFRPHYRLPGDVADNALHILCHPEGLRQFMPNWTEYAEPFVREINREASMGSRSAAQRLRDDLYDYPGMPVRTEAHDDAVQPLLRLREGDTLLSFYTTFATFALPSLRQPRHIKIENLYPADPTTAHFVEARVRSSAIAASKS